MMNFKQRLLASSLATTLGVLSLFSSSISHAEDVLTIEITKGIESAIPIAIVPFAEEGANPLPVDVSAIIASDLAGSGLFKTMPAADMPSKPSEFSAIMFDDWRRLGMDNLVIGTATETANGAYAIEFRLADVYKSSQLTGLRIMAKRENLRFAAHQIADKIYETLIGEPGAFATRISYITVRKTATGKRYNLEMADQDGQNPQLLLESNQPIMSPAWSPDGRQIAYVSFEKGNSAIYVQEIVTGKRRAIASGRGINSSPSWSPDGQQIAMTRSGDGNPEIYVKNLASDQIRRITNSRGIDTEAVFTADGRSLIFTSDRGGSPQLYQVPVSGGSAQRLTFNVGKYNAAASLSANGENIALVHQQDGAYRIGVFNRDQGYLDILTDSSQDESPSFAPNGKMIIYATSRNGRSELAAVSVDGKIQKRLAIRGSDVREPAWGPYLR